MTQIEIAITNVRVAARRLAELQNAITFAKTNTCVATAKEINILIADCALVRAELESRMKEYDQAVQASERING